LSVSVALCLLLPATAGKSGHASLPSALSCGYEYCHGPLQRHCRRCQLRLPRASPIEQRSLPRLGDP
jgi:hypothetical protein